MTTKETVLKQLATLNRMPMDALREQWRALFGTEPPQAYAKSQLVRRLAWRIQELHYGGLSEAAKQRLREIADNDPLANGKRKASKPKRNAIAPGTRLIRTWHGIEHTVIATHDGGFDWNGQHYRTLSAVANAISGQHCSGPRFFGLTSPSKEKP